MSVLDRIRSPRDLRALSRSELDALAVEIRQALVTNVSRTGGHLGPNLGVVELTIAIHRVFDSPRDPIVFDTGHQSYVHKMLTGRGGQFASLRQKDGLAGYPSRAESAHDWVENSHASASISWGTGLAEGFQLQGQNDRTVVVVVGDGALTGGMAWEALNNLSAHPDLPVVVVVNDNGRSYEPTVGGLAQHLNLLRANPRYEQTLDVVKRGVSRAPLVGRQAYELLHGVKVGMKDVLAPQGMFSDLGIKYLGPIDGHDLPALQRTLEQARNYRGPVLVHCLTQKGRGFKAAEEHEEDRFHAVGQIDEITGEPLKVSTARTWTSAFGEAIVDIGDRRPDVVAITAAMLNPTGLAPFARRHPERIFDVGIAEQHALTSAAGMASAGLHPVVAIYATFLNRAFDQMLMDIALHRLGVTVVLDRSGITGPDGPSHHGMWDMSLMGLVPGLRLAAPRDASRLEQALREAVDISDAPTVVRYGKDAMPAEPIDAVRTVDGIDIIFEQPDADVLLIGYGPFAALARDAAHRLSRQGISARVADPVWALPVNDALVQLVGSHRLVVSIEDNIVSGGLGSQLQFALAQAGVATPLVTLGLPRQFIDHASRGEILDDLGLTAQGVARRATEAYIRVADPDEPASESAITGQQLPATQQGPTAQE